MDTLWSLKTAVFVRVINASNQMFSFLCISLSYREYRRGKLKVPPGSMDHFMSSYVDISLFLDNNKEVVRLQRAIWLSFVVVHTLLVKKAAVMS